MPFGDVHKQGILMVSCAAQGDAFEQVLKSRLGQGEHDHWLDFTQADMGRRFRPVSKLFEAALNCIE